MLNQNTRAKAVGVASAAATTTVLGTIVTGASASAMTSFLATMGSVVGGGMAAGILVTVATPIAVGSVAYGAYKYYTNKSQ